MKIRLLFVLFQFVYITTSFAQIIVTNETFPNPGDTLFVKVDNLPEGLYIGTSGPAQDWNFLNLEASFLQKKIAKEAIEGEYYVDFPKADALLDIEIGEGYFEINRNQIALLGYAGRDPLGLNINVSGKFSEPYVERRARMEFEDKHVLNTTIFIPLIAKDLPQNILNNLPLTPDSLRINFGIERNDEIDAWGTMTVPDGIYEVLREKRVEKRNVRLEAKIGLLDWQDVTNFVTDNKFLGEQNSTSYYFFSNKTIEPIAIVKMKEGSDKIGSVAYKADRPMVDNDNISTSNPGVYVSPNPAIVSARFEFKNLATGTYQLKIFNILGVEVWKKEYQISSNQVDKIPLGGFQKGTYLYSLIDEKGKTLTTKRLMVVKP